MRQPRMAPTPAWRPLIRLIGLVLLACLPAFGAPAAATPSLLPQLALQFEEPLVPTHPSPAEEDAALAQAILEARRPSSGEDFQPFEHFLAAYPHSAWRLALLTNLGLAYARAGYFPKALDAFESAWREGQSATGPPATALADRAAGELLRMQARLGHIDRLAALLDDLQSRSLSGPATELRDGAKQTLWRMQHDPDHAFRCGPAALKALLRAAGVPEPDTRFLDDYAVGPQGTTLAELGQLATRAGLPHRLVHRAAGEPVPVPSIVHWNSRHFTTILSERDGRYEMDDPAGPGGRLWVTRAAVDSETSGLFLVPGGGPDQPWREATASEAQTARGAMPTQTQNPSETGPEAGSVAGHGPCPSCTCHGMCGYRFTEMVVSLSLSDTPVGYTPPKGPPVPVTITYNQREAYQPATFGFFNVSPKWTLNWLSYIADDPTSPGANVTRYRAGGGLTSYAGFVPATGQFTPEARNRSVLTRVSASLYRRSLPDGSVEVFGHPDGAAAYPRRVFLTQLIDPAGNAVTLNYDTKLRLTSVVDATGRSTAFAYTSASYPLQITQITDPFGRFATLAYDGSGRLSQITDVLGMTSGFAYDTSSLVNALTTPYGKTTFVYGDNGNQRYLQATDPLGQTERLEWLQGVSTIPSSDPANTIPAGLVNVYNNLLNNRDTFYWDKYAYAVAKGDYTKARIKHWCEQPDGVVTSNFVDSVKNPLENRVWTNYIGQSSTLSSGTFNQPIAVGRVLDDGTTQLTQVQYNAAGNPTSIIDPVGRTTTLQYAANLLDVLAVRQTTASGPVTTAAYTYNTQHRPLTATDAAGKTTTYAYNAAGQLTKLTDPLGHVTTYAYNSLGYLTSITNANGKTQASFTYDSYGRVATRTDSEGWAVSFAYDALDRVTKATYPDATTRTYTYSKLDLVSVKDRQGRITASTYDAVRNLTSVTDPLGQVTKFGRYPNGALQSLTDPNGRVTTWTIDIQSRPNAKQYADGSLWGYGYEATTSRPLFVFDPLNQIKQYSYTPDNRLAGVQYYNALNATPGVSFAYDRYFPRQTSMTDGTGTRQYTYQPPGSLGALQLAQESGPYANTAITYQYDALGRLTARSVGGNAESFAYDALGRLTTHTDDLGSFTRSYLGQTVQLTGQSNGKVGTSWTYGTNLADRRLTAIANGTGAGSYGFTTTAENDITAITDAFNKQTLTNSYDAADRLLGSSSSTGAKYAYGYDAGGNIGTIQRPSGTTTVTSNSVNQVVKAGTSALTYDANGNLIRDYARTYQWDADNRLIGIGYLATPGTTTSFRYDGMGRRVAIGTNNGVTSGETRYLWCGQTLCQARSGTDAVLKRYLAEGEETLDGWIQFYYGVDQLGSVHDALLAGTGASLAHYDYEPYGNPIGTQKATVTDIRYGGLFYHQQSGLYLANYRAYDPVVGRWVSRDPIHEEGGLNLYAYVGGNPLGGLDPLGLAISPAGYIALGYAEAAAIEVAGLGPENPIADVAAAAAIRQGYINAVKAAVAQAVSNAMNPSDDGAGDGASGQGAAGEGQGGGEPCPGGGGDGDPGQPNPGNMKRASPSDLSSAAQADGYSSVEDWKTQELQLNSRSDIVKDSEGNLYSIPRQGSGVPQPLGTKLP